MSTFPPIGDYAFLSNCEQSCLVAPDGSVEWLCLPRPDSPSVFGALLHRGAGSFRFGPTNAQVPQHRRYVPGTMVLETTWQTPTGWLVVHDLLVMGPAMRGKRRDGYHRAPADVGATGVLLRLATCLSGRAEVLVNCAPLFNYGTSGGTWSYQGEGYESMTVAPQEGELRLQVAGDIPLGVLGERCYGRTTLAEGESAFVGLSWGSGTIPGGYDEAVSAMNTTIAFWRDWLSRAKVPDHPWRIYIDRSALTLKGLSYGPTGAIMAAATTSLPETPGGARNWDYRYTWIRDSAFMLRSLYRLGFDWEAVEFFGFIIDAVSGGDLNRPFELQVMYGIGGERDLTERTLDHMSGYQGAQPVRVGNGAWNQQQHDVWGMILDALDVQFRRGAAQIVMPVWEGLAGFVEAALRRWREPDQGIWEVRGDPKHFVASKVMCWVAAERGADLARERGEDDRAQRWQAGADEIKAEVLDQGVSGRGVFKQQYETDELDAALLLLPIVGFLPPDDERIKATVLAIADELTKDDLVLRYRVEATDTGFEGEEGTFTICSFWLVSALTMIGQTDRARALCQKLLSFAGPLLLYAEEIDTSTGQHLGNFPQAFTHLALIEALSLLIASEPEEHSSAFAF
ncbi:MAG TPA: glycoside hydrolase family 15 protein [Streptosporangiaceae bacterium]|nr:glycoside hydrolase family 15 protein [Streptosporangiaceae bacterium]